MHKYIMKARTNRNKWICDFFKNKSNNDMEVFGTSQHSMPCESLPHRSAGARPCQHPRGNAFWGKSSVLALAFCGWRLENHPSFNARKWRIKSPCPLSWKVKDACPGMFRYMKSTCTCLCQLLDLQACGCILLGGAAALHCCIAQLPHAAWLASLWTASLFVKPQQRNATDGKPMFCRSCTSLPQDVMSSICRNRHTSAHYQDQKTVSVCLQSQSPSPFRLWFPSGPSDIPAAFVYLLRHGYS